MELVSAIDDSLIVGQPYPGCQFCFILMLILELLFVATSKVRNYVIFI